MTRKIVEVLIDENCIVTGGLKTGLRIGWICAVAANFSYTMTIVMLLDSERAEL